MPAKRIDEENLAFYMPTASNFIEYELANIESFESIANLRGITIPEDIADFISFFKQQLFVNNPDCLIELYTALSECEREWGAVNVANVFDFTTFKFCRYAKIVRNGDIT